MTHNPQFEIKAATSVPSSHEVSDAYDVFARTFETYKQANDERLAGLEQRLTTDPVTEEKLARMDAALDKQKQVLDDLSLKNRRPVLSVETASAPRGSDERKAAFSAYIRQGDASGYARLNLKALSAGTANAGGYTVPVETESEIGRRLTEISPIRAIASVRQVSALTYKKPFSTNGFAAGWVGETDARPQTANSTLAELNFPAMELYAMPAASQTLLDDSAVDIDRWIAEEVESAFATQETTAFVSGDGVNKPTGFLNPAKVAESAWAWGSIGYIASGAAGAFAASNPADPLLDLVYALKSGYRQNARFVFNRRTQAALRKLKDTSGQYIWQPPAQAGGDASLLGFAVTEAEDMPNIGANSHSIAFGDFKRGYLIVDRIGVNVLRDPYSAKPYVLFYTTKRVGGGVQDFDAIKLMKFAVS
jgi:HK97 family phage major capsid protein